MSGAAGDRSAALLDRLSASHVRACLALLALGLVLFLPGQASLQPMDRDEPRFAQATKQMLETGDFVAIRFQGEARNKKPVGIYWAQAAAVAAGEALGVPEARTRIALYRIPSLLGALASVLLAYWAALAFLSRRDALLAAALFGGCLMLNAEAHLAKTDAVLAACATASLGALARVWLGRRLPSSLRAERSNPGMREISERSAALDCFAAARNDGEDGVTVRVFLAFWLGLALGILVKGPMVPLFVALPALFLSWKARSARWLLPLRLWAGLALTVLIVAPWFVAITLKSGGAFYAEAVGKDMLGKVGGAAERHWGPPGAYTIAFFATFWPAAAFTAMALPLAWRERRADAMAFLIAAVLPAWLVFEAVPTKLPHYVLPLMPWLAILTVMALRRGEIDTGRRGSRATALLVPAIPVALTLGLCAVGWKLDDHRIPWIALPVLALACLAAAASWLAFARGRAERALVLAVAASCCLGPGILGLAQRQLPALKVSPRLAALKDALPCRNPLVGTLGYREPSLVFLTGTTLDLLPDADAARAFLQGGGCRLLFVEGREREAFNMAWPVSRPAPAPLGEVDGFNLNTGRRVFMTAYGATP
ncbi:ArnT family glycosyltransferase [Methylobacterium aerolatum]|uniref:4-amino-4-deoxy-L-arabinose transferase-like glycosyltransferase n=1 Tax=Methylobacterium aerolatum TaxID=418708 RepID=A0ABU0I3Y6_9HYPH|nr:glycosyltransferase family 39 protein [Methylobacterium aerolatum]MDQ0449330.1 4-amino-4-deoxy-L-arabinose transferase-like glycosyltransferase [Methylobacterium aerolatum]GJD36721.1 Undecaprenyl phosphate-alpha-4-amino-4-deoxy-L-arabinose arabinosyl transferase [Methylobacterium aerolatum]